jgi:hypothetical protein
VIDVYIFGVPVIQKTQPAADPGANGRARTCLLHPAGTGDGPCQLIPPKL